MGRESDKHGPRLDDEMEHETRSLTQGSPVEARIEQHLLKETTGDEPGPAAATGHLHPKVQHRLKGFLEELDWPMRAQDIVACARERDLPPEGVELLEKLSAGSYGGPGEVWAGLPALHGPA